MAAVLVPSSANPIFDGGAGSAFENTLTTAATPSIINVTPGEQYVFSIAQDATGNHAFNWQANVVNPTDVNPAANAVTVQGFVCRSDGNLYPTGPATYN
jgi:hypothetical protein